MSVFAGDAQAANHPYNRYRLQLRGYLAQHLDWQRVGRITNQQHAAVSLATATT